MTFDPRTVPVAWSWLKEIAKSPAHARYAASKPDGGEQSLAMRLGSGVHALTFGTPAVTVYEQRRAGKAWEAFEADAKKQGVLVLNPREFEIADGMATALRTDPVAAPLLFDDDTEHEQPMEWTVNGRAYRTRGVDFRNRARKYIGELKSARTAAPDRFMRDTLRALYPAQVEIYDEGDAILTGRDRTEDPFTKYIVAVEPAPPHVVVVYRLAPSAIADAQAKIGLYRSILAGCEASGEWPGYALSEWPLEVEPAWNDNQDDDGAEVADAADAI